MGSIYEYLEAVLGDAENEPQAEEGKQAEESEQAEKGKQGFIDDLRAWLKKEKECRQDLADGLLGELKKKFEDIKSELKKENKSEKEKCEKKEKWEKRWCRLTASIAYRVELTIAYVNHRLKLTLHPIVYSLTVAVAWLLIWVFFLVNWILKIAAAGFLLFVFPVALLLNVWQIFHNSPDLIASMKSAGELGIGVAASPIGINALALFWVLSTQIVNDYMDSLTGNFIESFLPPDIRIGEGFIETGTILSNIAVSMTSLKGSLILLLGAALLAATVSSATKLPAGDTNIEHNNYHLYIDKTASVPVSCPDNKSDKPSLFMLKVLFQDEAKLEDWLNSKKNGKCEKDCPDSEGSQNAPDFDSSAVKPDRQVYEPVFRSLLKGLSACGSPEQKARLEIVGFSSSSGVLASLKDIGNRDKATKKLQEGQEKFCYERASGNGDQKLSNAFNLCMAELRAWNVKKMLKEIIDSDKTIPADNIEIKLHKWASYSEMCQQRGFPDLRKEGECYDTDLGLMNRRAEIRAMALPGCMSCCPANGMPPAEGEEQMPPDSRGKTCGQCASPVVCSRNPDITNQP